MNPSSLFPGHRDAGAAAMSSSSGAGRALDGCRVLDLTRILAGPLCTQMLADHGADVIKVEPPTGDDARHWGPPFVAPGQSAYFAALNRNKRNLSLDLKQPAARAVLDRLLARMDVLVENFHDGLMRKWGWDYESQLADRFPRLIYCRITGYGMTGPMAGVPGYDAVIQAYTGLMSVNGYADAEPVRIGPPVVDLNTAAHAATGILLALVERGRSGRGQLVDCSLLDTAVNLLHPFSAAWLATGEIPSRVGSEHPMLVPYGTFTARGGLVFIGAGTDRQFRDLVEVLGDSTLADEPRYATNAGRLQHRAALRARLNALIAEHKPEALAMELQRSGVPASVINDVARALTSSQVRQRHMLIEQDGYRGVGFGLQLGRTPPRFERPPQPVGADSRSILADLGHSPAEIDRLLADRAVVAAD